MADKDRSERLKAALRDNLKRRKAQARGRDAGDAGKGVRQDGSEPAAPAPVPAAPHEPD